MNILSVQQVSHVYYLNRRQPFQALKDVSFELKEGEILGIAGESGAGKSTLIRLIAGLEIPASGRILFQGQPLPYGKTGAMRHYFRQIGMVFQHPGTSFNPRWRMGKSIGEPLLLRGVSGDRLKTQVAAVARQVGLSLELLDRYPRQLSGGQLQRAAIARAVIGQPRLILLDEPTAALDVSIQAQIINVLLTLHRELEFGLIMVSHNLAVLRYMAHRLIVMRAGQIVEAGETEQVIHRPTANYTRQLVEAVLAP